MFVKVDIPGGSRSRSGGLLKHYADFTEVAGLRPVRRNCLVLILRRRKGLERRWKGEPETRSAGSEIFRTYPASMIFDDRPADGETNPHTVSLGREARLEQLPEALGRYAWAVVGDRDLDEFAAFNGADRDLFIRFDGDGLTGIMDEVHQHLLDLHPVSPDDGAFLQ